MEKFGEWKHVNQISKWEENSKTEWIVEVFEPGYYYLDLVYKRKYYLKKWWRFYLQNK